MKNGAGIYTVMTLQVAIYDYNPVGMLYLL
jgi:hypothetical protein